MTGNFLDNNLNTIQQNEVHIWAVDLDTFEFPCNQSEQQILPESEREKSERFRFDIIRMRYVRCHYLLRILLGQYLGVDFYNQEFYRNRHGKPSLKSEKFNSIYFNLSNSENICLYVFAHDGEVGVDVEKLHDLSEMGRIVERFFSPQEIKQFRSLPVHSRKEAFFKYWTRKESVLKAMGVGLSFPLDQVDVLTGEENETSEVFVKTHERNDEIEWTLQDINVFEGFAAAVALEGKHHNCSARLRHFQLDNGF